MAIVNIVLEHCRLVLMLLMVMIAVAVIHMCSCHQTTEDGCMITESVEWWLKIICTDNKILNLVHFQVPLYYKASCQIYWQLKKSLEFPSCNYNLEVSEPFTIWSPNFDMNAALHTGFHSGFTAADNNADSHCCGPCCRIPPTKLMKQSCIMFPQEN